MFFGLFGKKEKENKTATSQAAGEKPDSKLQETLVSKPTAATDVKKTLKEKGNKKSKKTKASLLNLKVFLGLNPRRINRTISWRKL